MVNEKTEFLKNKARQLRMDIINMIYEAKSGHPGGSLSAIDIMTALYYEFMNIDPGNPGKPDRDRLIMSKGHCCPAWYACLADLGFFDKSHLKTLRKFESILQGHPDMAKTPGIDMTSGSLGMGAGAAVGMALEGKMVKGEYYVYCILGDGEIQEGIVWEAMQAASKFKLDNLVFIIDDNKLQMDGFTKDIMPCASISEKVKSFGIKTAEINGHDMDEILAALTESKSNTGMPFCIIADTVKGKGVSFMENERVWHGKTPNSDEYETAVKELMGV